MSKKPLVSIIINNYNYGRFLNEAIDSALSQTYSKTEIIVVDDGSTDNSREVIASYGAQITAILKENGGQASTFNTGFRVSRGEVVIFLDADDMLSESAAELAANVFSDPDVVNVCWRLRKVDLHGRQIGVTFPEGSIPQGGEVAMLNLREELIKNGPIYRLLPPTSGNAWSAEYLRQVIPIHQAGEKTGADTYLSVLAPLFGRVEWLETPESLYRCHTKQSYHGRGSRWVIEYELRWYPYKCDWLQKCLRRQGIEVNPEDWKRDGTSYSWMRDMLLIHDDIENLIPSDAQFILIDDGLLGVDFFSPYQAVSFMEHNRLYAGPPSNDMEAIENLERLYKSGFEYIVLISSSFWWLDHYSGFAQFLRSHASRLVSNSRLIVFSLKLMA